MSFQAFPEGCDRIISYLEEERVSKNRGIVTERIQKVFVLFVNCAVKGEKMKELKFMAAASCVSGGMG